MTDVKVHPERARLPGPRYALAAIVVGLCLPGEAAGGPAGGKPDAGLSADLDAIRRRVTAENIRQAVTEHIAVPGSSRVAGYPGCDAVQQYLIAQLKQMGYTDAEITVDPFDVTVPVEYAEQGDARTESFLEVAGPDGPVHFRIHPLWPNLIRTCHLGVAGLTGELFDAGDGKLRRLNGIPFDERPCVLLMDFNSEDRWVQSFSLGARAVIFPEPDETLFKQCAAKFLRVPLHAPRFYMKKAEAARLRRLLAGFDSPASQPTTRADTGPAPVRRGLPVRMVSRVRWEKRSTANILVRVPARDFYLKRLARASHTLLHGKPPTLTPEERKRYWPYDLGPKEEHRSNLIDLYRKAETHSGPQPFVVISTHYDAMSVVPSIAPGMEAAPGIVAWLELARYLRNRPPPEPMFLLATSAHYQGRRGILEFLHRRGRHDPLQVEGPAGAIYAKMLVHLDLTPDNDQLGIWHCAVQPNWRGFYRPLGQKFPPTGQKVAKALGLTDRQYAFNCVSRTRAGDWTAFIPTDLWSDAAMASRSGLAGASLVTINDGRAQAESPLDGPGRLGPADWQRLERQIRLAVGVLAEMIEQDTLYPDSKQEFRDLIRIVKGRAVTFMRRKSPMPDEPVPGAIGVIRFGRDKTVRGVRTDLPALANEKGEFQIRALSAQFVELEAYKLDPYSGGITYASDRGPVGAKYFPMGFGQYYDVTERSAVLFRCKATGVFDLVDPLLLNNLKRMIVYDHSNTSPGSFGYSLGSPLPWLANVGNAESTAVVFTEPGRRFKLALGSNVLGHRMLLLNYTDPEQKGRGPGYDPEGNLTHTTYRAARDMFMLDEVRIQELKRHRISNARLEMLHNEARDFLRWAEQARAERRYDDYSRYSEIALGLESRAYPDVRATQNDVIRGVLFYLALLLPAVFFLERLVFTFSTIGKQLSATLLLFVAVFAVMSWAHPAFRLANPMIILLSFVIMSLSLFVIILLAKRFEAQVKHRQDTGELVHETDVARSQVTMTAFLLGVANMKRRRMRTLMTLASVMLMTFAVLSFTSVKDSLPFIENTKSNRAIYEGIQVRDRKWKPLEPATLEYIRRNFQGSEAIVSPRCWYRSLTQDIAFQLSGRGANPDKQSTFVARGLVGVTPQEQRILSAVKTCLLPGGRWFRPQGDAFACILPKRGADALGVTAEKVAEGKVKVNVFGKEFLVIGILDEAKVDELGALDDLDGEPITPADFSEYHAMSQRDRTAESRQDEVATQTLDESAADVETFDHMPADSVVLLPYQTVMDLGGEVHSIAVYFPSSGQTRAAVEDLLKRLGLIVFASIDGQVSVISSLGLVSISGMGGLLVPVILVALIIFNTMIGSVYDRVREIRIFSSVGMAPVHIFFLFMAESLVYAMLGVTGGYLVGQVLVKVLGHFGALGGLELNYSSMSAVLSALVVMLVVVASTAYPAIKAARIAVPDAERKARLPEPVGERWEFEFPFTVPARDALGLWQFLNEYFQTYSEESVGTFYANNVRLSHEPSGDGQQVFHLEADLWLAPYDLGVSQHLTFTASPEPAYGERVYKTYMDIHRTSGEMNAWKRVNNRLIKDIRKQFLIWRVVTPKTKAGIACRGAEVVGLPPPPEALAVLAEEEDVTKDE